MIDMLAQEGQGGSPLSFIIFLLPLGLLFFLMRSQKKKLQAQQALQQAEVGDEILTTSGIYGTIVETDDDEGTVVVEIAPGTQIKMVRAGISRRLVDDEEEYEEYGSDEADGPDDNAEGPIRS